MNLDPHSVRETTIHLDLVRLGLPEDARFDVVDLVTGQRWRWGRDDYVRLDAYGEPAHVLSIDYASMSG